MGKHHIIIWLIIIYLIIGVIFYFTGESRNLMDILLWPKDAYQLLINGGLVGQSKPSAP
jgi:hypothetical protein